MLLLLSHDISQRMCELSQVARVRLTSCPTVSSPGSPSISGRIADGGFFLKCNICDVVSFVADLCFIASSLLVLCKKNHVYVCS